MKVLSVVGARPQFVKLAPVAHETRRRGVDHRIVHTGQHYDPVLSDVFFADLDIPAPAVHLGVGSGSHGRQTGQMLAALDEVLAADAPDWVLVYGDTNSTLAAAVAAVKLHVPVAHLEAGLRSFNRRMPEEHNRVLTDHAADLLLAPTPTAMDHLAREGLAGRARLVGDVMTDVLYQVRDRAGGVPALLDGQPLPAGGYYLATIHRAESTDDPPRLRAIVDSLAALDLPVVLLAHPRLRARARDAGVDLSRGALRPRDPLPYPDLVAAARHARGIVTDSGGLQKEAFLLRTPCTTVRTETEWAETVALGWNVLAEPGPDLVAAATRPRPAPTDAAPYGDGHAAARVLDALAA
ncbi:UDP-N-acetylglucosamine 2-epimerase (non-hydrolyzing) [Georgenia sp. TF02-10]|uniref:non-hydrolyzing UDP-N-acetylglucosamine 2-epimerase n=1 Tax=Georgenia sp. TF02-10 TaxID=2917725 RepID=UPI001FA6D74C|nr:UDP-N-acetylglucosamine 2-epimerase (non-hydrolyzing) [Georgenia sp. TF02-10]UNX55737.1 UDP-N-acetylglucosamine 2-epimerase (non-hydrolyzing) [Georgenia sp. TF02-10]